MKIKILFAFGEFVAGQIIDVLADSRGVPRDQFWRNRLRDAEHDKCCCVHKESEAKADKKAV